MSNDLRIEDGTAPQDVYAGFVSEPIIDSEPTPLQELRNIVLWLSKQQWKQENDQTWEGLLKAYEAEMNPEPLPELPSRAYRVGK